MRVFSFKVSDFFLCLYKPKRLLETLLYSIDSFRIQLPIKYPQDTERDILARIRGNVRYVLEVKFMRELPGSSRFWLRSEWTERCLKESKDSRTPDNRFLLREVDPFHGISFLLSPLQPKNFRCGFLFHSVIFHRYSLRSACYTDQSFGNRPWFPHL